MIFEPRNKDIWQPIFGNTKFQFMITLGDVAFVYQFISTKYQLGCMPWLKHIYLLSLSSLLPHVPGQPLSPLQSYNIVSSFVAGCVCINIQLFIISIRKNNDLFRAGYHPLLQFWNITVIFLKTKLSLL